MSREAVVALAEAEGWEVENLGGGCEALSIGNPDGGWWWITDHESGPVIPHDQKRSVDLGLYDSDGEMLAQVELAVPAVVTFPCLSAALRSVASQLTGVPLWAEPQDVAEPGDGMPM